jgi:uncharacterized membrane protein (DUF485 family)
MKKIILIYGLISGAIVSALMLLTQPLLRNGTINLENGMLIGYTTMVIALSLVFFGIKSFRDQHLNGVITFGGAFKVGILIALMSSMMYAISWEIYYTTAASDFLEWYNQCQVDKMVKAGKTEAEIFQAKVEMAKFEEMYKNPLIRFGFTLAEIIPVGLLITLISAGLLRKKEFLPNNE